MAPTKVQALQFQAIDAINHIVEMADDFNESHDAINRIREHLEARAAQTAPPVQDSALSTNNGLTPKVDTNTDDVSIPDDLAALIG